MPYLTNRLSGWVAPSMVDSISLPSPSPESASSTDLPKLHSLFLQAAQVAIIATDVAGTINYWNPFAERLYGWSFQDVVGRNIMEITVSVETEQAAKEAMQSVQAGNNWAGEFQVRCKDGNYMAAFVTLSPIRNHAGVNIGIVGVSQDIRSLKEAEGALRRSEEQFQAFANSLPELSWMARPDGHVFWYNERWYEYTGTTPQQMEGWGWQSVHDPEILPSVLERWKSSLETGTPFEMQFPLRGADGVYRWFLTRIRPVHDLNGKVVRWYGANTNVDEQRLILESLSEAHDNLEKRVEERTAELKTANQSLRERLSAFLRLRFSYTSQTAITLQSFVRSEIPANVCARYDPRPPTPITAILILSLAPTTLPLVLAGWAANPFAATPSAAPTPAACFMKFLRFTDAFSAMCVPFSGTLPECDVPLARGKNCLGVKKR